MSTLSCTHRGAHGHFGEYKQHHQTSNARRAEENLYFFCVIFMFVSISANLVGVAVVVLRVSNLRVLGIKINREDETKKKKLKTNWKRKLNGWINTCVHISDSFNLSLSRYILLIYFIILFRWFFPENQFFLFFNFILFFGISVIIRNYMVFVVASHG